MSYTPLTTRVLRDGYFTRSNPSMEIPLSRIVFSNKYSNVLSCGTDVNITAHSQEGIAHLELLLRLERQLYTGFHVNEDFPNLLKLFVDGSTILVVNYFSNVIEPWLSNYWGVIPNCDILISDNCRMEWSLLREEVLNWLVTFQKTCSILGNDRVLEFFSVPK